LGAISERELVCALAADRYLEQLEDGWQCDECTDRQKERTTCKVCGKSYEEKQADGSVRRYSGTDALAEARREAHG